MVAIVATVREKDLCAGRVIINQDIEASEIGDFSARYLGSDGEAMGVGDEMDLCRKATF